MDSKEKSKIYKQKSSEKPQQDDDITFLVNADIYKKWRSQYVDEIELSIWNIDMVKYAISNKFENYGSIKTAIQRGVPDIIKHYIWIKANEADKFFIANPDFYGHSFRNTFGLSVPSEMGEYCPTFCGGILGFQADVSESPLLPESIGFQLTDSIESHFINETEDDFNFWINPSKESSLSVSRSSFSSTFSTKSLSKTFNFFKRFRFRHHERNQPSGFVVEESDELKTSEISESYSSSDRENLSAKKGTELTDSSSSVFSSNAKDVIRPYSSDLGFKDRLFDYVNLLNHENINKRKLMKSALYNIRKIPSEGIFFTTDFEKKRQMSDTFIYSSKYKFIPPPPHHSKLIEPIPPNQSDTDNHNPFYNVSNKKRNKFLMCLPFICRSKRNPSFRTLGNYESKLSLKRALGSRISESPSHDTEFTGYFSTISREDSDLKTLSSETKLNNYVNRYSMMKDLSAINTIPEHSCSNSLPHSCSKALSGCSNLDEQLLESESQSAFVDSTSTQTMTSLPDSRISSATSFSLTPSTNKLREPKFIAPDVKEEIELVTKLTNDFTRTYKSKVQEGSVYKLTDVTDFTVLLTPQGVTEVKKILWCLNSYFSSKIEFLPIIPSLCCLLLIYMAPSAVLCLLYKFMLACTETRLLDCGTRFFFIDRKGFVIFVTFIISVMVSHLKKTVLHLKNLKVDLAAWIARSVQTGFSTILPFDYIVRIYGNFLFEGEIVLCRYCVALIKCIRQKLLGTTSKEYAEQLLYHIGLDPSLQIDKVTKIAFSLRIKKFDKKIIPKHTPSPYLMNVKIHQFYRPRLSSKSSIVTESDWEIIWATLKPVYRILDPHKLYSSNHHGTSMNGLIKRLTEHGKSSSPALLFIKTTKLHVFGVFIPSITNVPYRGFYTPLEIINQINSFVFSLYPDKKIYQFSGKNSVGVKLSKDNLVVGSKETAIIIDNTLSSGYSACSESYDSLPLVPESYFNVLVLELWSLF